MVNSFKCHSTTIGWHQVTFKKNGKWQPGLGAQQRLFEAGSCQWGCSHTKVETSLSSMKSKEKPDWGLSWLLRLEKSHLLWRVQFLALLITWSSTGYTETWKGLKATVSYIHCEIWWRVCDLMEGASKKLEWNFFCKGPLKRFPSTDNFL